MKKIYKMTTKKDLKILEKAFRSAKGAEPFVRDHTDRGFWCRNNLFPLEADCS